MKILSVNLFYKEGSTGKILELIHKELVKRDFDSHVCYAIGKHNEKNLFKFSSKFSSKFYTYLSAITGRQYTYSYLETRRLIKYISKIQPDIVNIHAININVVNVYKLLEFLKKNNYKTIITFHSEIFYTGGCSHAFDCNKYITECSNCPNLWEATHSLYFDNTKLFWNKFKSLYSNFNNLYITCVSEWLKERTYKSPFFQNHDIKVIRNGVNTSVFKYNFNQELREKYSSVDQKIILHVTPSFRSKIKGGEHVLNLIKILDPEKYIFLIIGYDADYILPQNVFPIKTITDQKLLAEFYSISDVTLLTSKAETFSMVCVESLSCGTPMIGYRCGAPEQICLPEYSSFVEQADLNSLKDELVRMSNMSFNKKEISLQAQKQYSNHLMTNNYINYYKEVFNRDIQ